MREIVVQSFGFKYRRPEANFYFDVSFLKNPAREFGLDSELTDDHVRFVLDQPLAVALVDRVVDLLNVVAQSGDEIRVAFGCSGGRHRSVVIADQVAGRLKNIGLGVRVCHLESRQ